MKQLFKKRFKKLTALVVALVMMLLPGQSLLAMETKEYDAQEIADFYNDNYYYMKILKQGDVINWNSFSPKSIWYYGSDSNPYVENNSKSTIEGYDVISNDFFDYSDSFKGWEVFWVDNNGIGLDPVYQFATVKDVEALNADKTVIFRAELASEIPKDCNTYEWGYAVLAEEPVTIDMFSTDNYFINPDDNKIYQFIPFSENDGNSLQCELKLEYAKDLNIVLRLSFIPEETEGGNGDSVAMSAYTDGPVYYSNLAYVKIKEPEQPTTEQKPATQPSTDTSSTISKEEYEKNSATMIFAGKLYWKGKKLVAEWGALPDADGYDIIAVPCGQAKITDSDIVKTVPAGTTKVAFSKLNGKKLKLSKSYKVMIKAFKGSGDSKQYIGETLVYHSAGKNSAFTNAQKVTLNKKKITLKAGKTFKLTPKTIKLDGREKLLSSDHAPLYRYLSSNTSVATVSKSGKITAVGKGSCKVYAIAINGFKASIKVTVK